MARVADIDTVAFTAVLDDLREGVFAVTSGGVVTTIADTTGVYNDFVTGPAISSDSTTSPTVAFPGLRNGDFQTGFMDGWTPETGLGGAVTAVADQYTFTVQEEAPEVPLASGLLGIGLVCRRRRGPARQSE